MQTPFPRLIIRRDALVPQGSFAEAQASYLRPDPETVRSLDSLLAKKKIGVVAHFYMDPELQGVLSSLTWPHVHIADSLKMADAAVQMAEAGVRAVVVLGVDFMSENVRAVLNGAGHAGVRVYRAASEAIGCSLAESAERPAYDAWLDRAAATERALHVVYINTSLRSKARAQHKVPTITCTSSNVLQTLLTAAAQIPEVEIFYGPDTYMGANLAVMLAQLATLPEERIRQIHPAHDAASLTALLDRFHWFEQGVCVVHHMFGEQVVAQVKEAHGDAMFTAHLEVPGEMFQLAVEAQREGRGVVGSTSNILAFILDQVKARPEEPRLSFVLGTEAGMITPIVRGVQQALEGRDQEVEIVFPVAAEAVAPAPDSPLALVPGIAGGEGCSTAGGCATCPFMKMNDLDRLFQVAEALDTPAEVHLAGHHPQDYTEQIGGRNVAELGSEPILAMRHFQRTGRLPDSLVEAVQGARISAAK